MLACCLGPINSGLVWWHRPWRDMVLISGHKAVSVSLTHISY